MIIILIKGLAVGSDVVPTSTSNSIRGTTVSFSNEITRLEAGLGPIKGVFTGEVVLKDVNPPEGYVMELSGKGKMGFLKGRTRITLRSAGENRTEIVYESDLQVGGLIASVGSRFIPAAARDFSKQFFSVLEEALSS